MAKAKSTKKTPKVGELVPQPNGRGALRFGGTNKGGPGRPPDAWKARMRALADRGAQTLETKRVLEDETHPLFEAAWKFATEQGHGKASQNIDLTSKGESMRPVIIRQEPA